jgi:hypothetical protein
VTSGVLGTLMDAARLVDRGILPEGPGQRSLGAVAVTNYSRRKHGDGDPDVQVCLVVEGGHVATGFIDARWQRDCVWGLGVVLLR